MSNEWPEYSVHVLKTLDRLETKIDKIDATMRDHIAKDGIKLTRLERDLKWHARIAGIIAAAIGASFPYLFGHDKLS